MFNFFSLITTITGQLAFLTFCFFNFTLDLVFLMLKLLTLSCIRHFFSTFKIKKLLILMSQYVVLLGCKKLRTLSIL